MKVSEEGEGERGEETDFSFVGCVDEEDEPPRLILLIQREERNVGEEDRLERLGDLQVVRRAQCSSTEFGKGELGDVRVGRGDVDLSSPDCEGLVRFYWFGGRERVEEFGELGFVLRVDG